MINDSQLRGLIDAVTERMVAMANPCWCLKVDESVPAWRGVEDMFHVTKIDRKPQGAGLELKAPESSSSSSSA